MNKGIVPIRDACFRWKAQMFYDANRAIVRMCTRVPVPSDEIAPLLLSGYAVVTQLAETCKLLPRSAMAASLYGGPSFLRALPRNLLFWWVEHTPLAHHPYEYLAQATAPCGVDDLVEGGYILYIEDGKLVRLRRTMLKRAMASDLVVEAKKRADVPDAIRAAIDASARLGLCEADEKILAPLRLGGRVHECAFAAWTMHYLDPTFDNSPSLAALRMLEPDFPRAIETLDKKVLLAAYKHAETRAVEERLFLLTADMGGEGTKADRIRKRFFVTDLGTLRRIFLERSVRMFWAHGEWTGRYLYEYVVTQRGARMYLDLDLDDPSPAHSGDDITRAAIALAKKTAAEMFDLALDDTDFLVLECDRKKKISRHVVVRPMVFETVADVRVFAGYMRAAVMVDPDAWPALMKPDGECMIDPAVYNTGCQSFRPFGCSKAPDTKGGTALFLRVAEMNVCPLPHGADDFDLLIFSLVQCVSFAESPPETRLRFDMTNPKKYRAIRGERECELDPCVVHTAKRKNAPTKMLRVKVARTRGANELPLGVEDQAAVFRQLLEWLEPAWGLDETHLGRFEVRMTVRDHVDASFAVFRKPGKGGYCAILARSRMAEGATDPATFRHDRAGVQFYLYSTPTGWSCTQRCRWRCGDDEHIVLASGRASPALSAIVASKVK